LAISKVVISMPTLLDIAIGLPILLIMEERRRVHERFLFFLEVVSVIFPPGKVRWRLVENPDELGYELVPASEFDFEADPFSYQPIKKRDVFPEGVLAHAN